MRRRNYLTLAGASLASVIAGCTSSEAESPEDSQGNTQNDDDGESDEILDKEHLVNSGKFTYGHNLHANTIVDIDPTSVVVELNVMVNPIADYDIHAHYIPLSEIEPDYIGWDVGQTSEVLRSSGSTTNFNYSEYEWEPTGPRIRFRYAFKNGYTAKPNDSVTIPKESYEDMNRFPSTVFINPSRRLIPQGGFPAKIKFDLDMEIPKHEPFVIGFSWEDDMTHSDKSGQIVAQTQQVVRNSDDEFIYPRRYEQRGEPSDNFDRWRSWANYEWDDVNHTGYQDSDSERALQFTRLSNFSIYSDRYEEYEFEHSTEEGVGGPSLGHLVEEDIPHYTSSPVQNLWGFNYSLSHDYAEESYRQSREIINEESERNPVNVLSFHDDILSDNVVQEVSQLIYEECQRREATPIEQVRFIADFVSFFDHTWDLQENPADAIRLAPGTADPVYTMYRTYGDCKDYTVLMNAILQQDEFGFSPKVARLSSVTTFTDNSGDEVDVGHVSPAIPMREVGLESVSDRLLDRHPSTVVEPAHVQTEDEEYLYVEASTSLPLGYVPAQWSNEEITIL